MLGRQVMSRALVARKVLSPSTVSKSGIVSGPPKNRISFTEKVAVGTIMSGVILAPTFYFLYNLNYYRSYPGPLRTETE